MDSRDVFPFNTQAASTLLPFVFTYRERGETPIEKKLAGNLL